MHKPRPEFSAAFFQTDNCDALPSTFGIVTAYNPNGELTSEEHNRAADSEIASYLETVGLPHFRVTGGAKDGSHLEAGFAIPAADPEVIRKIALRFQQEAFFWVVDGFIFLSNVNGSELYPIGQWRERQMK